MNSERSRLIWRCRRGIREMDILLQDFLNHQYDSLQASEQQAFQLLLDEADLDIMNWLMGKTEPTNENLKHLIKLIRFSREQGT